ncbi:hypothetical protein QBC35DRAFT_384889 [Podospora australis]|uniref:Uncharacterized protein n=1 Tax=Podospora australis TaxID=1536484 RepID=A0AAN6WWE9_9PEZI|nr:hypothetical protein QBC35DRAFT_384889 [Podospora australis]
MEDSAPKRRRTSPRTSPQQSQPKSKSPTDDDPRASTPDSAGNLSRALSTKLGLQSVVKDGAAGSTNTEKDGTQGKAAEGLRSPARRLNARRAVTRPNPRPLPPPAPEDEEINPFARRGLRRSPVPGMLPDVLIPEPELPPTPERPDPVVSTPPSGIHNTPSKRPKRNRALAEKIKSSSPLKHPPMRPTEPSTQIDITPTEVTQPSKKNQTPPPPPPAPSTAELRGIKPVDPDEDKKKLRDSLLAEIAELERDLDVASKENERIRQAHLSKRPAAPPSNNNTILDVLRRHVLPPEKALAPDPTADWLASALNPIAFLPFGKGSLSDLALPTLFPPADTKKDKPIITHDPIPMTAEEALPYLQVFTPLTFTSHIYPLPRESEDKPLLQKHFITASSAAPNKGLFTARLEMTVNTKTMAISSLAVPKLDPSAAAELSPFIAKVTERDDPIPSSGLHNNISILTWSMGEWLRVSVERAKVWRTLEQEVSDKTRLSEMAKKLRETRKSSRKRKRPKRPNNDDDQSDEEDEDPQGDSNEKYEASDLLPYMGRTCMDLDIPLLSSPGDETSALRVQWKIEFDWTGEARSDLGVLVGMPGKWHQHDERGRLSDIPKLFDELIQGGEDPLTAVRTVVSLLAGELRD